MSARLGRGALDERSAGDVGRIGVKSQLGAGSTFTFTVPVRRGE